MKRILCLAILLCVLCACRSEGDSSAVPMSEQFTISTYVYDEATDSYHISPLQLNEVRHLPLHDGEGANYHLYLTYERGSCQIISENKDVEITAGRWLLGDLGEDRVSNSEVTIGREGFVVVLPFSGAGYHVYRGDRAREQDDFKGYTGCEFYLTVHAQDSVGNIMATARLKMVQLEDVEMKQFNISRYFSIEMISYEYSDMYKMMEGAS
ncbi:MAG: hypothetical protein IJD06_11765 [Clostridia bacterium]|nr:hypothetical protein [Clostridia bacterium]